MRPLELGDRVVTEKRGAGVLKFWHHETLELGRDKYEPRTWAIVELDDGSGRAYFNPATLTREEGS